MFKRTVALVAAVAIITGCGEGPTAPATPPSLDAVGAARDHSVQPEPGTTNCHGQAAAFVAQAAKHGLIQSKRGVAGAARAAEITVKAYQANIEAFCSTP